MRALVLVAGGALVAGISLAAARAHGVSANVKAFAALLRELEANGDYQVIAGGDHFQSYAEHPFVREWDRVKPLGTTASGAYQMVRGTWMMARDALGLADFTPASQDAAALWILQYKVPGQNAVAGEGTGVLELVQAGRFDEAIERLRPEWESLDKMVKGRYRTTLDQARAYLVDQGATFA